MKILGAILELYQLNSTADFANLAQFWGKWAGFFGYIISVLASVTKDMCWLARKESAVVLLPLAIGLHN